MNLVTRFSFISSFRIGLTNIFFSNYMSFDNFRAHYNVYMKEIEVGDTVLELPTDVFDSGDRRGTIIDSGTTLAYLPEVVYDSMMNEVTCYSLTFFYCLFVTIIRTYMVFFLIFFG